MRVTVDIDICESNGVCVSIAPEVFTFVEDDYMHIVNETPSESLLAKVEQAVKLCPRQALTLHRD